MIGPELPGWVLAVVAAVFAAHLVVFGRLAYRRRSRYHAAVAITFALLIVMLGLRTLAPEARWLGVPLVSVARVMAWAAALTGISIVLRRRGYSRVPLAIVVTLLAAALTLRAMGRTIWCACGAFVPVSLDVWSRHNSQHLIDPYTATHILHGLAFYALLHLLAGRRLDVTTRAGIAVGLESLWEVLENTSAVIQKYREATISLDYYGDSVVNSLGDIAACLLGFALAAHLRPRTSLALFVAFELVLLASIRDGLLLNVLMLLYPVPAIRAWQMGAAPGL